MAKRARKDDFTWIGILAVVIATVAVTMNLVGLNLLGIIVAVVIGAWMYEDSGKKKFKKDERAWMFTFGMLCGVIGAIAYLLTRTKKGKKPVMRWMMWIVLTVILFAAGFWLASLPGFATF